MKIENSRGEVLEVEAEGSNVKLSSGGFVFEDDATLRKFQEALEEARTEARKNRFREMEGWMGIAKAPVGVDYVAEAQRLLKEVGLGIDDIEVESMKVESDFNKGVLRYRLRANTPRGQEMLEEIAGVNGDEGLE